MDKCKASCLATSSCLGFDFNGGCYHHLNEANLVQINSNAANVDHYRRRPNPACGGTTPPVTDTPVACSLLNSYEPVQRNTAHEDYGVDSSLETLTGRTTMASYHDTKRINLFICHCFFIFKGLKKLKFLFLLIFPRMEGGAAWWTVDAGKRSHINQKYQSHRVQCYLF